MSVMPTHRAGSPAPWSWSPLAIPSLVAWWDADWADGLDLVGGAVRTWTDAIGGFALTQSVSAARPAFNPTGFNGRAVVTFDGVDDCLEGVGVGNLPANTATGEVWGLADQTTLPADTAQRSIVAWGGAGGGKSRSCRRVVVSVVNRFSTNFGDGAANFSAVQSSNDFSGRCVFRSLFGASSSYGEVDGVAGVPTAATLNTNDTTRTRIGSVANVTASTFYQGGLATLLAFDAAPSASDAARLLAYLTSRK